MGRASSPKGYRTRRIECGREARYGAFPLLPLPVKERRFGTLSVNGACGRVPFLLLWALISACSPQVQPCTVSSCTGCCDARGSCQPGNVDLACGFGGAACSTCSGALSCQASNCLASAAGGGGGGGGGGGAVGGGIGGGAVGGGGGGGGGAGGGQTGTVTITGRVTYDFVPALFQVAANTGTLDFAAATQRPVRNGVVRVVEGTAVRAMTTTAADGAYSLTFTLTGAGAPSVQALAKTASPVIIVQDNTAADAVWAIGVGVPSGGGTVNLHATHGWNGTSYSASQRTAAPFAILDSMYTAATAFNTPGDALKVGAITWNYGNFVSLIINFLIVALTIFLVVRAFNRMKRPKPNQPVVAKDCPACTMSIPVKATRCPHCTSELAGL